MDFLWLELTARCNLRCVHCYAESSPTPIVPDELTTADYETTLEEAAALGCRKVQFIGGEPTLDPALPALIVLARRLGYEFVEVFTNAVRLREDLLSCFVDNRVAVATSFYCDDPMVHDGITRRLGSHVATVATLRRLVDAGLEIRAGVIAMEDNAARIQQTIDYLEALGVANVRTDRVRAIGRGADLLPDAPCSLGELCGNCWRGTACVSPDGTVSPCIMAKPWSVGSMRTASFAAIAQGDDLHAIRARIYTEVWLPASTDPVHAACNPGPCNPDCSPNCSPCYPYGKCNPQLFCGPCGPKAR